MKVSKMIRLLEKMNPDAEVKMHMHDGDSVLFVVARKTDSDEQVWLECEHDLDMGSELDARYKHASEVQMSELEFFTDLLELGIDTAMVRKYMGDEYASHMEVFCKEHGLWSFVEGVAKIMNVNKETQD